MSNIKLTTSPIMICKLCGAGAYVDEMTTNIGTRYAVRCGNVDCKRNKQIVWADKMIYKAILMWNKTNEIQ